MSLLLCAVLACSMVVGCASNTSHIGKNQNLYGSKSAERLDKKYKETELEELFENYENMDISVSNCDVKATEGKCTQISGVFSKRKLADLKDAVHLMKDVSGYIGIKNVEEDIKFYEYNSFYGCDSYKFVQLINGIRVYGSQYLITVNSEKYPENLLVIQTLDDLENKINNAKDFRIPDGAELIIYPYSRKNNILTDCIIAYVKQDETGKDTVYNLDGSRVNAANANGG